MRILILLALLLGGCAGEELATRPPSGVDLSGHWKLNEADSDDAMRLTQASLATATAGAGPGGTTQTSGRGGRQGSRGGLGPGGGPLGPATPPVLALDEALRWPGRDLAITQSGAAVSFSSGGRDETCRPGAETHHRPHPRADDNLRSHDAPDRGRGDAPPPRCGWDQAILVVRPGDIEEDHAPFDQAFSLSEDHQRLIEVVTFRGGRSSGFTASRVWDRAAAAGSASGSPGPTGGPPASPAGAATAPPTSTSTLPPPVPGAPPPASPTAPTQPAN